MAKNGSLFAKISIWWDIENCHVPKNVDPHCIAQNLRSALHTANFNGPITIDVFADTKNLEHRILDALSSTGVNINHITSGNKDAADKAILVAMLFWALENPPPAHFLLISGDGDFANALHRLRLKGYNILLARPEQPVKPALLGAATNVWFWTAIAKGQIDLPPEERVPHADSSGKQSIASGASANRDTMNMIYRSTSVQDSVNLGRTSSRSLGACLSTFEANKCLSGGEQFSNHEEEMLPRVSVKPPMIQEALKEGRDMTQLESSSQSQNSEVGANSTSVNWSANKQLHTQKSLQTGPGTPFHDSYLSSNKITGFTVKRPSTISSSMSTGMGHSSDPSKDVQKVENVNMSKLIKTFERLKVDGLTPSLENMRQCFNYWEKQNGIPDMEEVLSQALNQGFVEDVLAGKEKNKAFLPNKIELWKCYDVHDMEHAFSEVQSKSFYQFLCCSKNWQFFLHTQSIYDAAQRLKRDGPSGIRNLAVGEIIHLLNQAVHKWKWLDLQENPRFSLSIRSQAVLRQVPSEDGASITSSSQLDKDVRTKAGTKNDDTSVCNASTKQFIFERLRTWLKETVRTKHNYDISSVRRDFESETGIHLDHEKLGFVKFQQLLEEFSDVVTIQQMRKGLKILCPASCSSQQQMRFHKPIDDTDPNIWKKRSDIHCPDASVSCKPAPPFNLLPHYVESVPFNSGFLVTEPQQARVVPSNWGLFVSPPPRHAGMVPSYSGPSVTPPLHGVMAQTFTEKAVSKNHPVMRKLRSWLLQWPNVKHGYDISLVKKDFFEATGTELNPASLGYSKVKDIVSVFKEDFHIEYPKHGLALLFTNDKGGSSMNQNAGNDRINSPQIKGNANSQEKPLQYVKCKAKNLQWKELHQSAGSADENIPTGTGSSKEAAAAGTVVSQPLCDGKSSS
ncbi:hypothetical protein KP509_34G047500 [Ceratopteris richardii]|nr:hypothetical protein KP509_34G047500 [Ceratopteris richardii]KAH7284287.1 hypothetical protein KP509_34G047500 [Ceratopteris richardii]KAH7284288.1 hypothetical protein KP509_34G047500 [Ceratopteris richardii]KAH7284289.1 hypothetical protein KP509_34G047500 [Ceratopteris richardii]KAH7284290.1 hypothetical protein KP509_34G047500 [Ceratopteris richardii]